ncbi:MAG: fibronectin type III domain-containing protein [Treponema sp.]|jgi:fibronectin type 3 domain-containing protein|nr:fibronectin type III domain-containing protein [Treponema sp.]
MKRTLLLSGILGMTLVFGTFLFTACPNGSDDGGDTGAAPNTPTGVSASAQSSSAIRVSWNAAPGATSYKVYRSGSSSGAYTQVGSPSNASYTDSGLTASTTYYYKVRAVNSAGESAQSSFASATTSASSGGDNTGGDSRQEGVYIGIISFAGDATDLTGGVPVFLDATGKNSLTSKLTSDYTIASAQGTALFYAVHKAFANLKSRDAQYPANLDSVNVVTFTDGLDNGSTGQSAQSPIEEQTFDSDDEYTAYLNGQIGSRTIAGKPITAYSVGIQGSDVTNVTKFQNDLAKIASEGKSQTLTDFGNLQATFTSIANGLQVAHTSTTFTMKTTLLPSGAKVRMTFDVTGDSAADGEASTKYIEGTITRTGTGSSMAYTFGGISYTGGLGSTQGAGPITGTINGSEVNFAFTGVTGYTPATEESKAKQWLMSPGATAWQVNSEYDVGGATNTQIEKRSSIIYLVLDSSRSLNTTQIGQIRDAASQFINSLYDQLNGGNNNGGTTAPNAPTGVTASALSSSSVNVSWTAAPGATSYKVYRSGSPSGTYTQVGSPSSASYTDTGLSSGTTYYYKVSAVNSAGESAQSSYTSATTSSSSSATVPSAPTGVSASAQSSSSISVSWTAAPGATSYKVYWSESMYGTYELDGTTTITTSFISGEWYPSSAGYFKVTAVNSAGESAYSSIVSATTSDAILLTSSSSTWTNGALSASSPDAWYRVSVPTSSYPYYLSGRDAYYYSGSYTSDVSFEIYNSDFDLIETVDAGSGNTTEYTFPSMGTWYVKVVPYGGSTSNYGTYAIYFY